MIEYAWCYRCQKEVVAKESAVARFVRDAPPECLECGEPVHPDRFGPCYECRLGNHQACIGVPCECECPGPQPAVDSLTCAGL